MVFIMKKLLTGISRLDNKLIEYSILAEKVIEESTPNGTTVFNRIQLLRLGTEYVFVIKTFTDEKCTQQLNDEFVISDMVLKNIGQFARSFNIPGFNDVEPEQKKKSEEEKLRKSMKKLSKKVDELSDLLFLNDILSDAKNDFSDEDWDDDDYSDTSFEYFSGEDTLQITVDEKGSIEINASSEVNHLSDFKFFLDRKEVKHLLSLLRHANALAEVNDEKEDD